MFHENANDEFAVGGTNPQFEDKIQIAMELFDNALKTFDFSAVTFTFDS